jgi:hypothetical protein
MSADNASLNSSRFHLQQLRSTFLKLHKALLEFERKEYEQIHGRIASPNEFLRLAMGDDWFNWLRPFSQFIVQMDDVLGSKDPVAVGQIEKLIETAHALIQASEDGSLGQQRYFYAIQRDFDTAILHVEVARLLNVQFDDKRPTA